MESWLINPKSNAIGIVVMASLAPLILSSLAAASGTHQNTNEPCKTNETTTCQIHLMHGWWKLDVESFAFYTTAISVACQAVVFISLGAVADHGRMFLLLF
jgi:MFS transporter, UMF1 family